MKRLSVLIRKARKIILPTLDADQCDSLGQVWDCAVRVCAVCTQFTSQRTQRSPVTVVTSGDRSRAPGGQRGERDFLLGSVLDFFFFTMIM